MFLSYLCKFFADLRNCFKLNNHLKILLQKYKKIYSVIYLCLLLLLNGINTYAQSPIYEGIKVNAIGILNSIGSANINKNMAISKGAIYTNKHLRNNIGTIENFDYTNIIYLSMIINIFNS